MTSPQPEDRQLDRIRKLLAKAEADGVTVAEAKLLTDKAAELMAKYGVDKAMLQAKTMSSIDVKTAVQKFFWPYADEKRELYSDIANVYGCQVMWQFSKSGLDFETGEFGDPHLRATAWGFESDLRRLDIMFTSLAVQQWQAVLQIDPGERPRGNAGKVFIRNYMHGWTIKLYTRLLEEEKAAAERFNQSTEGEPSVALVLFDRLSIVWAAYQKDNPEIKAAKPRDTKVNYHARALGWVDGNKANIGAHGGEVTQDPTAVSISERTAVRELSS